MGAILDWLKKAGYESSVAAVGHRIVHGGPDYAEPVLIDDARSRSCKALIPLAPLHQPHNIAGVEAAMKAFPSTPQVACFDTAFHRSHPFIHDTYALPRSYYDEGVRRYGFHGLSYEFITRKLRTIAPEIARKDVIIAHLGNGASMCAVHDGRAVATTMGFTALDGLSMGTRCGQIDPGVVLYLMAEKKMSADAISDLLWKNSGLKGMSGLSQDMRELEASDSPAARDAIAYFVSRIRRELAGLAATVNGAEAIVFTAGIGEHSWKVREAALKDMEWMGVHLDARSEPRQRADHQRQDFADDRLRDPDQRGTDDRRAHGRDGGRRQHNGPSGEQARGLDRRDPRTPAPRAPLASAPAARRCPRRRAAPARSNTTALTPFSR